MNEHTVLDRELALSRVDGDISIYNEVVTVFLDDVPRQLSSLHAALGVRNYTEVERIAHSLKSAAANVGGVESSEVAERLEIAVQTGSEVVLNELANELTQAFTRLEHALVSLGDG